MQLRSVKGVVGQIVGIGITADEMCAEPEHFTLRDQSTKSHL